MKVVIVYSVERCYHTCPHFGLDGGPGAVMICNHPQAPDSGHIISHPDCETGFPAKCPLRNAPEPCMCGCDCLPCQSCDHK